MLDLLLTALHETALVYYEGAFYVLIGFAFAGLLHEFLPRQALVRHLGSDSRGSVARAALFGAPLPLCSCGVLPAAAALRRQGASRSATLSFLISTPETGVDSIALTYGLLGPVMAVIRPVVAIVTALVAGSMRLGSGDGAGAATEEDCCGPPAAEPQSTPAPKPTTAPAPLAERCRRAATYGFSTMLDDIAFWLVVGFALTGLFTACLPDDFFSRVLGWESGWIPILAMLVAGTPLYVCASASTPVAAALLAKGLSPGAALVFLLVGPATNLTSVSVVAKILGGDAVRAYLGSIVLVALAAGLALDALGGDFLRLAPIGPGHDGIAWMVVKSAAALALVVLLAFSYKRTRFRSGVADLMKQGAALAASARRARDAHWRRPAILVPAAALAVGLMVPRITLVVMPGHQGIITRLGTIHRSDLGPGLYAHWPPPWGSGRTIDCQALRQIFTGTREQGDQRVVDRGGAYTLTGDENVLDLRAVVSYRVSDVARFALHTEDPDQLVEALAHQVLTQIAAAKPIDSFLTEGRRAAEEEFEARLSRQLANAPIGCELVDAHLAHVHAPRAVHQAFRDVASALEDRERAILEARAKAIATTRRAAGEASTLTARAQAETAGTVAAAAARATAFTKLALVHQAAPAATQTRLYLETMDNALARPDKVIQGKRTHPGEIELWLAMPPELPDPIDP